MNFVAALDVLSFAASLGAVCVLVWFRASIPLRPESRLLLMSLLSVLLFHSLSNALEWSLITSALDTYEDFLEILEPFLWGFFLYAILQQISDQALRDSEERFRKIVESSGVGYFFLDLAGCYRKVNRAWTEIHRYSSAGEVEGKPFQLTHVDKDRSQARHIVDTLLSGNPVQTGELTHQCKDGTIGFHIFSANPVLHRDKTIGLEGFIIDTTERRRAAEGLRCLYGISNLIERQDLSFDATMQGIVESILPAWQYPDSAGARISCAGRRFTSAGFEETGWKLESPLVSSGACVGAIEVCYREPMPRCDEGPFLREERHLLNDIAERVGRMIERTRAMEMLGSERDKFQGVLNAVGDGLYIVNTGFGIEFMNDVADDLFGSGTEKPCHEAFMGMDAPCDFCRMREAVDTGHIQRIECVRGDGKTYDIAFSPFTDVDGATKVIILLRDITEKKTMEAEAARAGHLASLGELAAGVAHEINNPINGIINYAEIMRDDDGSWAGEMELPRRIIKEGERVAGIVSNLLSFARDRKETPSPAAIADILSDTVGLVETQIQRDGIRFVMNCAPDLPRCTVRSQEIQQVFLNILSNARHALNLKFPKPREDKALTITGETVTVEGRSYVRTTFHDRGTGIPEQILDRICNPFFSTKPKGEGTGLGLSISHGIVKNHGGMLWFESVEGLYTKVNVDLPVHVGREPGRVEEGVKDDRSHLDRG